MRSIEGDKTEETGREVWRSPVPCFWTVSSVVERFVYTEEVAGSIPAPSTVKSNGASRVGPRFDPLNAPLDKTSQLFESSEKSRSIF